MKRILLGLVVLGICASPAYAYDPDERGRPPAPSPSTPPSRPIQLPPGLYRVTEVYAGDVVTRSGDLTTYATRTEHRVTDTYARVLETVASGVRSRFDGSSFNGRRTLSNGIPVGGTYYQNFVLSDDRFVPISIVFFQDDNERDRRETVSTPAPTASASPPAPPTPRPGPTPAPGPTERPTEPTAPVRPATNVTIGLDPVGGRSVLVRVAVLRGARYEFAVNARGMPIPVTLEAWQLVDGFNEAANAPGWHSPAERLRGRWSTMPAPDGSWTLTLRVQVRAAWGGPSFEATGRVEIVVHSPAVID